MSIKQDNNRNEPRPPVGEGNRFVDGGIGDPRDHGMAGLRLLVDRVLQSVDGFGGLQFEAAGTSVREIAKHRDEATLLLARVVRDDGRRASRQRHRSAALRLLGHLKATDQVELLLTVAHHEGEPVTTRAAAFDALGHARPPRAGRRRRPVDRRRRRSDRQPGRPGAGAPRWPRPPGRPRTTPRRGTAGRPEPRSPRRGGRPRCPLGGAGRHPRTRSRAAAAPTDRGGRRRGGRQAVGTALRRMGEVPPPDWGIMGR